MWRTAWTALVITIVGAVGVSKGAAGQEIGRSEDPTRYYNDLTNITTTTARPANSSSSRGRSRSPSAISCEDARIKCALRGGCGKALHYYMLGCADLMGGHISFCDEFCKNSLIALTSTEEGHALMDCICSDDYCRETKARVEVCREEVVVANADTSVVSCSVAHWICLADTLCSTAIGYYDRYCRKMFLGKGCSYRCNNSIAILQRQEKAAKLETCICNGTEDFDCVGIKRNMARLCFHQFDEEELEKEEEETNEVDTTAVSMATRCSRASGGSLRESEGILVGLLAVSLLHALFSSAVVRWR